MVMEASTSNRLVVYYPPLVSTKDCRQDVAWLWLFRSAKRLIITLFLELAATNPFTTTASVCLCWPSAEGQNSAFEIFAFPVCM